MPLLPGVRQETVNILRFPKHKYKRCTAPDCDCAEDRAATGRDCLLNVLKWCECCNGAEGSLPTDCPGRRMTDEEEEAVVVGLLDYVRRRGWVRGKQRRTS